MWEDTGFALPVLVAVLPAFFCILWKVFALHSSTRTEQDIPGPGRNKLEAILLPLRFFYHDKSLTSWIIGASQLYGREGIFQFNIFTKQYTVIASPEFAETILNNTTHIEKPSEYQFVKDYLGDSVAICKAKDWKIRRKILNPAFHKQVIDGYIPTFNEKAQELVTVLKKHESTKVDFDPIITSSTVSTIAETAMGLNIQKVTSSHESKILVKATHKMSGLFNDRILTPWQWIGPIYHLSPQGRSWKKWVKTGKDTIIKVITARKEAMMRKLEDRDDKSRLKKRLSFLDLILNIHLQEGTLDLNSIQGEVAAFLFAGHDTSTLSLSWTLFLLSHHQEVQKKVQREIDQVMGIKKDVEQDEVKQLIYLECVFKESLRLFPPGCVIARKVAEPTRLGDYMIQSGQTIMINIYRINRDPKVYKDPERFDPDRFLPENSVGRSPFSFLSFSGGPRGCIGQGFAKHEAKIFLTWILREFNVEPGMDRDKVEFTNELLLRSRHGMPLVFKKRNR